MATVCVRCEAATATVACSHCTSHDDASTVVYCLSCSIHAHQELPTHDITPWAVGLKEEIRKKLEQYQREVNFKEFLCLELERLAKDVKNMAKLRERVIRVTTVDMQTMLKQVAMSLIKQMETNSTEIVSNLSMQYNASMQDVLSAKQMIKDLEGYTSLDDEGFLQSGFKEVDMQLLQFNTTSMTSVVPSLVSSVEAFDKTVVDFANVAASIKDVTFTTNSSKCDYQSMALPALKVESDLIMDVQISSTVGRNGVFYVTPVCSAEVSSKLRTLSQIIRLEVLRKSGWATYGQSGIEPSVGSLVYVRYPADKNWYRGVVEEVKSLNYGVRLLDFGNLISVQADSMLPAKEDLFPDCAAQAIGCCLFPHLDTENFPLDAKWYFSDNTKDVTVKCKFLECLKSPTGQNVWFCNVLTQSKHGPDLINLNDEINKKSYAQSTGNDSIRCRDIRYKYEETLQATYIETTATTTAAASMSTTEPVTSVAVSNEKSAGVSDEADESQSRTAVDEISSMSYCPADVPDCLNCDIVASVNSSGVASKESTCDINKSTEILSNAITSASFVVKGGLDVVPVDQSPFSNRSGHQYHGDVTSVVLNARPSDALLSAAQIIGGPAPCADISGHAPAAFRPQYYGNNRSEPILHNLNDDTRFPLPVLPQPLPVQQYASGSQHGTSATGQGPQCRYAEGFRHPSPPTVIQHQSSNNMRAITGLSTSQYEDNLHRSVVATVAADRGQTQPRQWAEGTIDTSSSSHLQPLSNIGSLTTMLSLQSSPASSLTLRHDADPFRPPATAAAAAQPWPAAANDNYYMQSSFIAKNNWEAVNNLGDITRGGGGGVLPSSIDLSNLGSQPSINSTIGDIQSLQSSSLQQILTKPDSAMLPLYKAQTVSSQLSSMLDAAVIQQQQQLCQAPTRYPADTVWPPYASGPPPTSMLPSQPVSGASVELLQSFDNIDLSKPPPVLFAPSLRDSRSASPGKAPLTAKALAATQNSMFCAMPSSRPTTGFMPTVPFDYDRSDLLNSMSSLPCQDAAASVNLRDILSSFEKSQLSSLALAPNSNTTARQMTETSNSQWQTSSNPNELLTYLSTSQCSQFLAPVADDTSLSDSAISTTTCADSARGVSCSAASEVPLTLSQLPPDLGSTTVVMADRTSRSGVVQQLTCDVGSAPLPSVYFVDSPCNNETVAYMPPSPEHMLVPGGSNQKSVLGLDVRASGKPDEATASCEVDDMVSNLPVVRGHALSGSAVDNVENVTESHDLTSTANSEELQPQFGSGGGKVPRLYDDFRCDVSSIGDALSFRLELGSYFHGRVVTPLNVRGQFAMTVEHDTPTTSGAWSKLNQLLQACRQQCALTEIHCGQLLLVSDAQGVCQRARVVENVDDQVRVYCIDYGYEQTVPGGMCWTLPEELHRVQPQAVWCSIATRDSVFFDAEQQLLFSKLTNGVLLTAHVFFINVETYHIRLENSGGLELNHQIYHYRELQPNRPLDIDIDDRRSVASDDRAEHNERQEVRVCHYCHRPGHVKNACPIRPSSTVICFECKEVGHTKRECPNVRTTITCFSCREVGHHKRNCPKTVNDREQDKDSKGQYFNSKRQQRHQGSQRKAKSTSSGGDVDKYSSGGGYDGIR